LTSSAPQKGFSFKLLGGDTYMYRNQSFFAGASFDLFDSAELLPQLQVRLVQMLINNPAIGENGHKIIIPVPPGDYVKMKMILHSRSGHKTQVQADIKPVRIHQGF